MRRKPNNLDLLLWSVRDLLKYEREYRLAPYQLKLLCPREELWRWLRASERNIERAAERQGYAAHLIEEFGDSLWGHDWFRFRKSRRTKTA